MLWIVIIAVGFIVLCIIVTPFLMLYEKIRHSGNKAAILHDDPQKLYNDAKALLKKEECSDIDLEIAKSKLIAAAEKGSKVAMIDIINLTSKKGRFEDLTLHHQWIEKSANAGVIKGIIDLYGIDDISMQSKEYDKALICLDNGKGDNRQEAIYRIYVKGVVNLEKGDVLKGVEYFRSIDTIESQNTLIAGMYGCIKYMLGLSLDKSGDFPAALKLFVEASGLEGGGSVNAQNMLWDYYYHGRDGVAADYLSSARYAKLYMENTGCNMILGRNHYACSCRHVAIDVYGPDGISPNEETAMEYHQYAAHYGDYDSKFQVAINILQGKIPFHYALACEYLSDVAENGSGTVKKKSQDIMAQNAAGSILLKPVYYPELCFKFSGGYELFAPKEMWENIYFRHAGVYKARLIAKEFQKIYHENFKNLQTLITGIETLYYGCLTMTLTWGVEVLLKFGIDTYDEERISDLCRDQLELEARVPAFIDGLDIIEKRATELNINLAYAKANRSHWIGGGFGMQGAIKGAVQAGALNLAGGVFHSIGDAVTKSINNSTIREMEEKLFNHPEINIANEFYEAVYGACKVIVENVVSIIKDKNKQKTDQLMFKKPLTFRGEDFGKFSDGELNAKQKNNIGNLEYRLALLIEIFRRNMADSDMEDEILKISDEQDKKVIERLIILNVSN